MFLNSNKLRFLLKRFDNYYLWKWYTCGVFSLFGKWGARGRFLFFFRVCTRGACIQPLELGGGDGPTGAGADIAPLLTGMDYKMVKAVFRLIQLRKLLHYVHTTHD